jgi:hypothetical protein
VLVFYQFYSRPRKYFKIKVSGTKFNGEPTWLRHPVFFGWWKKVSLLVLKKSPSTSFTNTVAHMAPKDSIKKYEKWSSRVKANIILQDGLKSGNRPLNEAEGGVGVKH